MKKTITVTAVIAIFAITSVGSAWAGRVKSRQVRQSRRISQGVKSGALTKRETRSLIKQQRRIQRTKKRAWSDGSLTGRERARLELYQDKASARIYRLKHNSIDR